MGESRTRLNLEEWSSVIEERALINKNIEETREVLAGLEEGSPELAETRAKIGELERQLGELNVAENELRSRIETVHKDQCWDAQPESGNPNIKFPKIDTGDLFSGNVITPQPTPSHYGMVNVSAKPEKPPKFEKGHNFTRFAKRFREHVMLCNLQGTRLDLFMLSFIKCEQTWEKLQGLNLQDSERVHIDQLIKRFTDELFPPLEATATRAELLSIKQNVGETVEQFCFRIGDLASKAGYESSQSLEDSCLNALITGATNPRVRERILENNIRDFRAAVKLATQTERIRAIQPNNMGNETDNTLYSIKGGENPEANLVNKEGGISNKIPLPNTELHNINGDSVNSLINQANVNGGPKAGYSNFNNQSPSHTFGRNGNNSYSQVNNQSTVGRVPPYNGQNFVPAYGGAPFSYRGSNYGQNSQTIRRNFQNNGQSFPGYRHNAPNSRSNAPNNDQKFPYQGGRQMHNNDRNGCWNCGGNHFRRNCPQLSHFNRNEGYHRYPLNSRWMTGQ